jgi:hypothetical protein
MPLYFFDVTVNGAGEPDGEGVIFDAPDAAIVEAQRVAGELVAEPDGPDRDVTIGIRGEEGGYFCEVELHITVRKLG